MLLTLLRSIAAVKQFSYIFVCLRQKQIDSAKIPLTEKINDNHTFLYRCDKLRGSPRKIDIWLWRIINRGTVVHPFFAFGSSRSLIGSFVGSHRLYRCSSGSQKSTFPQRQMADTICVAGHSIGRYVVGLW
jgi:hypothetical protein